MARRPIKITGAKSLRRALRRMPDDVRGEVQRPVMEGAEAIAAMQRHLVPRRTGALASVIEVKLSNDKLSARIGPGVKSKRKFKKVGWRAKFVEFGTKHVDAQPFVGKALDLLELRVQAAIAEGVGRALVKIAQREREG